MSSSTDIASIGAGLKARRWLEMLTLFLGLPLAVSGIVFWARVPLFLALMPMLGLMLILMVADRTFPLRAALRRGFSMRELLLMLGLFALLGGGLAYWVHTEMPLRFLRMPQQHTRFWLFLMVAYPVISVATQEMIYRVFFFHRYGVLFAEAPWLGVFVNAALFAFGHIMFWNWLSILFTFVGGLIFAWRYLRTHSFWAVSLEHALYGNLIFTIGLGVYFFTGVSNFD